MNKKQFDQEITLEPLLYGEYNVGIYDADKNNILDEKYYCVNKDIAIQTAKFLKEKKYPNAVIVDYS